MNKFQTADLLQKFDKSKSRQPIYPLGGKQINNYQWLVWELFNHFAPDNYIINQSNEKIIKTILPYFIKLPNFNKYGLIKNEADLNKGLLIWGDIGVGKTLLFDILASIGDCLLKEFNIKDFRFPRTSAIKLVDDYVDSFKKSSSTFDLDFYKDKSRYFDDLGCEKKAFNNRELLGDIMLERNRNNALTFATTNLSPTEIAQRYGLRIGDRLPEMFNIIKWEGESLRH